MHSTACKITDPSVRPQSRCRGDNGSAAVELTLVTPLLIVLLLFVVAAGRVTSARITVQDAAAAAARAVTLDPAGSALGGASWTGTAGEERARAAAATATSDLPCRNLTVTVTNPGDPTVASTPASPSLRLVSLRVACTVDLGDLTGLGLPATTVITATATSPRDRYRSEP
jgi:Flp pilus assembly protein TadG